MNNRFVLYHTLHPETGERMGVITQLPEGEEPVSPHNRRQFVSCSTTISDSDTTFVYLCATDDIVFDLEARTMTLSIQNKTFVASYKYDEDKVEIDYTTDMGSVVVSGYRCEELMNNQKYGIWVGGPKGNVVNVMTGPAYIKPVMGVSRYTDDVLLLPHSWFLFVEHDVNKTGIIFKRDIGNDIGSELFKYLSSKDLN